MIPALSNWDAHTSATEGEGRCGQFDDDCPFMGKMPGLVKISLGGASGGNDNNDRIDKDENNRGIDGVADLENQSDGVNETENDVEHDPLTAHDEDEQEIDTKDEVEIGICKKYWQ